MQARQALILITSLILLAPAISAVAETRPSFEKVYQSNDVQQLVAWGRHYEHGVGAGQDPLKALRLYCKAAR